MRNLEPALKLIKQFEGCRLTSYRDVVGVVTIGFGHTGNGVHDGQHITQEQADKLLASDVGKFAAHVESLIKIECTDNQFCALVSFAFNVGVGALKGSTLLRDMNHGVAAEAVANHLLDWVYAGHQVYAGLVRRRAAERELFLS